MDGSSSAGPTANYGTKGVYSSTNVIPARLYTSIVSDGEKLWIFGGAFGPSVNDMWSWTEPITIPSTCLTSGDLTSGSFTSNSITSGSLTSAELTSGEITSASLTTSEM